MMLEANITSALTADAITPVKPGGTIGDRIAAALTDGTIGSDVLAGLIAEAEAASAAADEAAQKERERSLDPTRIIDAGKVQATLQAFELERDRLHVALPQLQARYQKARAAEYVTQWSEQFKQVEARRNVLANELTATYPPLVAKLIDLLDRIEECDGAVDRVNGRAPPGDHRRLLGVELAARGLFRFTAAQPSLTKNLQLPHPADTGQLAYPPPQINVLGMQMVAAAEALATKSAALHSADWAAAKALEGERKKEEWKRINAQAEREQEARKREYEQSLLRAR